jgi:hypothetical protein
VKRLDDLQRKRSGLEPVVWEQEYPSIDGFFLRSMELSWSDYVLGLRSSVQKATIFYKRNLDAIRRNSFNEKILAMQNLIIGRAVCIGSLLGGHLHQFVHDEEQSCA